MIVCSFTFTRLGMLPSPSISSSCRTQTLSSKGQRAQSLGGRREKLLEVKSKSPEKEKNMDDSFICQLTVLLNFKKEVVIQLCIEQISLPPLLLMLFFLRIEIQSDSPSKPTTTYKIKGFF